MEENKKYDIAIIGGGPAGLTAALYSARSNKRVILFERNSIGGQMSQSPLIENYPGLEPQSGEQIAEAIQTTLDKYSNLTIEYSSVTKLDYNKEKEEYELVTDSGEKYEALSTILCMGYKHRELGLFNESELVSNGRISYCVTCDGPFTKGKTAAVIGDGNSALQTALTLSAICPEVTLISNCQQIPAYVDKKLVDQVQNTPNINFFFNFTTATIEELNDIKNSAAITSEDGKTIIVTGKVFICIGQILDLSLLRNTLTISGIYSEKGLYTNEKGAVKSKVSDESHSLFDTTPGLFAAGDIVYGNYHQAIIASGSGATAALSAIEYLDSLVRNKETEEARL